MNVTEVLQFVDQLVFERTGKHLDDVQRAVVEGSWEGETYSEIGKKNHFNKNHASDVGGDLWQLLSEALGEDIKKTNFRSTFERLNIESCPNSLNVYNINSNNNHFFHTQTLRQPNKQNQAIQINTKSKSLHRDLTLAPKIIHFYDRTSERETLSNWIFNQNTRFISVLGLSGVGKTTLVKKFVDLNLPQFEVIIWRSLKFPKSLDGLVNDLLNVCQQEARETIDDKLKQLFDILTEKKCLIILDDVQNIFLPGQFSGQYQTEYQDYQNFFTMITEVEHQSHLILISQELCPEMECLDEDLYPIKCLELSGLSDVNILKNTGLKDEDIWSKLIDLYEGNPMYFKDVAILIKDIFDGNVADFLAENSSTGILPVCGDKILPVCGDKILPVCGDKILPVCGDKILPVVTNKTRSRLNQLFNRLSPIEQQLVLELSKIDQPVSRENLREKLDLSSMDLINGLQSLQHRYLVTKRKGEKIWFKLSPVFREYVRNYCQD
jgi:ABC-type oligopeptide transport system ATPase subunit